MNYDLDNLVAIERVECYDPEKIYQSVDRHLTLLELEKELAPGKKILLKPNLLTGRNPAACITTHPAVIQAVIDWLLAHGADNLILADSPGGTYSTQRMRSVYHASEMDRLTGTVLHMGTGWQTRYLEQGQVCKSFNLIDPVAEADVIINLAKLKTHGMTTMSGGMKNLFGTIPGLQKPELHYLYPDKKAFSGMLADLNQLVRPTVTLIDAIEAMEGEGPSSGTVREMGYLFAARNHYAQDWVAAQAIGLNPMEVDMVRIARERGLFDPEAIQVTGSPIQGVEPFVLPKSTSLLFADRLPGPLRILEKPVIAIAKRVLRPVPKVLKSKCIGCGRCAESCPPKTISMEDKRAVIHLDKCISCFCCHEMCPVKAIEVKRTLKL